MMQLSDTAEIPGWRVGGEGLARKAAKGDLIFRVILPFA
jgi:hypothetical protein